MDTSSLKSKIKELTEEEDSLWLDWIRTDDQHLTKKLDMITKKDKSQKSKEELRRLSKERNDLEDRLFALEDCIAELTLKCSEE